MTANMIYLPEQLIVKDNMIAPWMPPEICCEWIKNDNMIARLKSLKMICHWSIHLWLVVAYTW